ncbi:glycerol-3-phosphate dehydrogenase/oxidase [Cytophagaceae bacterium DM2B3-1]|uniref:Glycerol-3-phosphate dehydrogenase n=1 Tax=Xanthocytophaga flava TaxID=3048013 RepID=A0ABT7CY28_9BACT|nr:glycerol-3-phosphate dehydrogenase/oxidase [Xanthocytophaga flavus]MDJ1497827.1 glycerol-3-phosphate dehydrogenase/oxidase [Xanthocytophaga flavus]
MSEFFSTQNRARFIEQMCQKPLDLLVIGGGITGAGIALDAVTRGMRTGLLEMQDFAAGTSSRSTKLIHGGLRYLKQLEIKLVAETGRERKIVYENGPHITKAEPMLLPLVKDGSLSKWSASLGLAVYDWLAKVPVSERRRMLSVEETKTMEPLLDNSSLIGGAHYYEYRTDDARLTIEVLKEAVDRGGRAVNYMKVIDFLYKDKKIAGVVVEDQLTSDKHEIYAQVIVNATGPWVDTLDVLNDTTKGEKLYLTKGVHIVVAQSRLPIRQALYFDTPDGRMVFAIPRAGKTYIGTTDTPYKGNTAHPHMTNEDLTYLLNAVNHIFPSVQLVASDVESHWVGLRPLIRQTGKGPSEISRKDEIFQYESGLISIAGGKLTGYRKMAERIVNLVAIRLRQKEGRKFTACQTHNLPVSGGNVGGSTGFENFVKEKMQQGVLLGLTAGESEKLVRMYGSNVGQVFSYLQNWKVESAAYGLTPVLFAQLQYALNHEMVVTPADFFIRRTGALYFHIDWVRNWETVVWTYLMNELKWSKEKAIEYRQQMRELIQEAEGDALMKNTK